MDNSVVGVVGVWDRDLEPLGILCWVFNLAVIS